MADPCFTDLHWPDCEYVAITEGHNTQPVAFDKLYNQIKNLAQFKSSSTTRHNMKNDGPQPNWNASDRSTMDRIKAKQSEWHDRTTVGQQT
ncbi:hypothetical protein SNOG_01601 [Parastagonospora nodorum SN15]|uniref:Uncharacterized protein n=1 Tax=Phaeosphaeria nodorum (strain SN15 / ATCC MYA-4574 / FGSC 10173) TaxID=321614 RepID=Q0V313_PHANO|nr:hypothetical protein SNOG_01601 [Parastagonospora nodorum SN15]EAT91250.1 hypothetical protein SNOG_01601 [Parastagonospora nodorum SN15]